MERKPSHEQEKQLTHIDKEKFLFDKRRLFMGLGENPDNLKELLDVCATNAMLWNSYIDYSPNFEYSPEAGEQLQKARDTLGPALRLKLKEHLDKILDHIERIGDAIAQSGGPHLISITPEGYSFSTQFVEELQELLFLMIEGHDVISRKILSQSNALYNLHNYESIITDKEKGEVRLKIANPMEHLADMIIEQTALLDIEKTLGKQIPEEKIAQMDELGNGVVSDLLKKYQTRLKDLPLEFRIIHLVKRNLHHQRNSLAAQRAEILMDEDFEVLRAMPKTNSIEHLLTVFNHCLQVAKLIKAQLSLIGLER